MTDKEKLIKIKKLADAMYYGAFNMATDASLLKKAMKEYRQFTIHEYCKEEPESEFLDTESMIESYKQRLISQVNGMKDSPFVNMCLDSYKHGINEILDTLNLSNIQRTVKNQKDPQVKESVKSQRINETCKNNSNSLTQEPASEDLEKAAEQDVCEVVNCCSATGIPNDHIPSWVQDAMINEFIHGAKWGRNQAKVEIQAQSMALAHGCPKEPVSKIIFDGNFDKSWYAHPELAFEAGAKWQFEQFEKNRLAACDKQTKEEAEIEINFATSIIEKEHRQPTFDDAIKYGMALKEQQKMNNYDT